jgi:alpha-L-fucosidase
MATDRSSRRAFFVKAGQGTLAASFLLAGPAPTHVDATGPERQKRGNQRLSLEQLHKWASLRYGMFIHFGMSTFTTDEFDRGQKAPTTYAPDRLDVDQWISVARDAGMRYAVLTTKHVAGHCLWPSKHTKYTVANSGDKTDVVDKFVKACDKRGVLPGFYYCSWDNHHRFGSRTPSDPGQRWNLWVKLDFKDAQEKFADPEKGVKPFTTSIYQSFQTAQITELLTQYGPIAETWVDIPGVLGRGYRQYLFGEITRLQPETVVMMNTGIITGEQYPVAYAWPADIMALERRLPPGSGHNPWKTIEGQEYYIPGEVCDPIGKHWFWVPGDDPRPDEELLKQFRTCRDGRVNLLLNVPPDRHGLIPDVHVQALMRLAKDAKL